MKNILLLLLIAALVACLSSTAFAANTRKGKKTYNKLCRSCHIRGGEGHRMAPSEKTKSQWQRFIDKNRHSKYPDVLNDMTQKQRSDLLKFLQEYAADADVVETCG